MTAPTQTAGVIRLRRLHPLQQKIADSRAKRRIVRAGRRGGKTTVAADIAVNAFCDGRRVLYAVPTQEQAERFWFEVKRALQEPIDRGALYKNETMHIVEEPGTERRIRAKTAYDANTLRGDYADVLILDEVQLMKPDAWDKVGAPMLLDNDGDAIFIYTTIRGRHWAKDLYKRAEQDTTGRWAVFHFSSLDNPYLSRTALDEIAQDMTHLSYRMEILAEDIEDDPRALWNREIIQYVTQTPDLARVVVGVDPPGGSTECGIVAAGLGADGNAYVLEDRSLAASPDDWGREVVTAYHRNKADRVLGEANFGGDMVESVIRTVDRNVSYKAVRASRGKAVRAEPVAALYEQGKVFHVGQLPDLEDEMCSWVPGETQQSPNRIDALVWALTELKLIPTGVFVG